MEEDKELQDMIEMEFEYKKACELHRQFENKVILKRNAFRDNCPHPETRSEMVLCYVGQGMQENVECFYCKRCKKLVKQIYDDGTEEIK